MQEKAFMASLQNNLYDFKGVWTAIATPFREDRQIDWVAFEKLLELQAQGQVSGIVISGTTGESPTLTPTEKLSLVRKARALLSGNIRIMAGTGDNNTQQSVELSKLAQDAGADSLLVVTPPYNKPTTAGLVRHYRAISDAVKIPVCLYHVPGRTAHMLTVEQMSTVCKEGQVRAVKEASADLGFFSRALKATGLPFLSGDDTTYLACLAVGGTGVISVVANIFPRAFVALTEAFQSGNLAKAQAIHHTLMPAIDVLFCETNPGPLKAALEVLGIGKNVVRPPLAEVSEGNRRRIAEVITTTQEQLKGLV